MVFNRLVQVGRVVFVAKGQDEGKIATIVDVVDGNRVLIDGPATGVPRGVRNLKDLQLTKYNVTVRVGQRTKGVKAAFEKANVLAEFAKSTWAKRRAAKALRAKLSDFDRFKLAVAKKQRNKIIRGEFNKLKKASSK